MHIYLYAYTSTHEYFYAYIQIIIVVTRNYKNKIVECDHGIYMALRKKPFNINWALQ